MRQQTRPSFLFLFPDQHRFDFLGLNPALPVRTPNLDALAARGTRLTRMICPSPLCAPSRASLASGRSYRRCGVLGNDTDYPLQQPTFYGALRESGYCVAGVGKFDLHKATLDWGVDGSRQLQAWGFSEGVDSEGKHDGVRSGASAPKGPYLAYLHERGLVDDYVKDMRARHNYRDTHPTPLPDDAYGDNWVAALGLDLLRVWPADEPWFLMVNFPGPHEPMDVTASMRSRWESVDFPGPHYSSEFDRATHRRIRQNYAAMLENIDRQVGAFLSAVAARGEQDRTIVVYSSDHGEMLGDHQMWGKTVPHQPSIGVPFIAAGPGIGGGAVSAALASVHDLAATFLDYAGLTVPAAMDSRSLRALLQGDRSTHRDYVLSGLLDWDLVWDGRYKLVLSREGGPRLYDLETDPWEDENIAANAPGELAHLQGLLRAELS